MSRTRRKFRLDPSAEQERRLLVQSLDPLLGKAAALEHDQFLSTREVALLFRVSPATVRRWADGGKLGAYRSFGGHRMFPVSSVRRALESMSLAAGSPEASARTSP